MMDWITKAVFYHIYPLGFCGAPRFNADGERVNRIEKLVDWIPHLKELGVNAVYLGPVFESSEHGYDTKDYYQIDKRLGDSHAFRTVCGRLHESGIRVVLAYAAVCMKAASAWCWMGCLTMWAGNSGLFGMYSKTAGAPATAAGSTT